MKRIKQLVLMAGLVASMALPAATVAIPIIHSKEYNGNPQLADVETTAEYSVSQSERTDVGFHQVILELNNEGDQWSDGTTDVQLLTFEITKAGNEWTHGPVMSGWTWGEAAVTPDAAARFGTVKVRYSGTTANGVSVTDALSVTAAGDYTAHFTVAGTANYSGLTKDVASTVARGTLSGGGASGGAQIAANGYAGTYDGAAHSIAVEITGAQPGESFTVTYSTDGTVYTTAAPQFTTVGTYQIWYRVESDSYATVENFETVTIAQKEITPPTIEPMTYTGAPQTAVVPTSADWTVAGAAHTIDTNALVAAVREMAIAPEAVKVAYAIGDAGSVAPIEWQDTAPEFVDAGEYEVWYKVSAANCKDYVHEAAVIIAKKPLDETMIGEIDEQTYTGAAVEPEVTVTDGEPSIIKASDYTVSYADNVAAGTARAIVTATADGNYSGTVEKTFTILEPPPNEPNPVEPEPVEPDPVDPEPTEPDPVEPEPIEPEPEIPLSADIAAEIGWKYLKATGTWFAQVKVTCTEGLAAGIDNLRFLFADRTDGDGTLRAALWSSAPADRCAVTSTTTIDGVTYRFVDLDATQIAAENSAVVFGVGDLGAATIPVDERTVEIYTREREIPVGDGWLVWESGGQTRAVSLMTAADANDLAVPHSAESSEVLVDGQEFMASDSQVWNDGTLVCLLGARIDDIPLPVVPTAWTVVVKKMPTGIKYDRKRGCLTGVPRKVGTFTMTATAKNKDNRKDVRVWTQTMKVLPLPKACVGRFTGKVVLRTADFADEEIASGVMKLTVSKNGKVSGNFKLGKKSWRFAATELELEVTAVNGDRLSGEVVARTTAKCGKDRMPVRVALCPFSDTPSDGLEIIGDNTYLPDIQSDWQGEGRLDMSEDWFVRK